MGQDLQEDAARLRGVVAQLNAAAAEAAAVVQAVDLFLGDELSIGVSATSRPFDTQRASGSGSGSGSGDGDLVVTAHLAYGRVQGKDRLHVLKATHEKNDWNEDFTKTVSEDRTPWQACSREVKLQSFAKLPELLTNLANKVEEVTSQTSRTVETVRALIDAMKAPHEIAAADDQDDQVAPEDLEVARDIPLRDLTASAAPALFKRPRPRSGAA
jgi:hypothetical protein